MFVSRLMLRALVAELENQGLNPRHLVLDTDLLSGEPTPCGPGLRGREVEILIERAIKQSADPALGLNLGQRAPETMLHVLGHLLLSCSTLREAFGVFQRYATLMLGGMEWYLAERDGLATFGFSKPNLNEQAARFCSELVLCFALRVGRKCTRETTNGAQVEVSLAHSRPPYAERYLKAFGGADVRFDQPSYGISFPRSMLDRAMPHADPMLAAVLRDTAEALYRQSTGESSFAERVRHVLRYEQDLVNVDFDRLAARWGMTRRTLRRRLSAEGISLSDLLDEACCRQAKEELSRQHESIKEIAERLGYSETSAFHRAFKRWTGLTPSEYRANVTQP